jgi:cytidine deaminase
MEFAKKSVSLFALVILAFSGCENPKKDIQADVKQETAVLKEGAPVQDTNYQNLISAAKDAREGAYCPYSKFKVGAAVLTGKGNIFTGCNIENASYGLTVCAERVAIFKAVSAGERNIKAIAIVLEAPDFGAPCGACRQVIYEFGKDADVIMATVNGKYEIKKIKDLLPYAFSLDK